MLERLHHHISYAGFEQWADRVNWDSIGLWATAIATAVLATGVIIALVGFWDSRRTRDGELITELSDRWYADPMIESRMAYSRHGPSGISSLIDLLYNAQGQQPVSESDLELFYKLLRWPSLIETIGVLHDHRAISEDAVFKMWGASIAIAWESWKDPVDKLRNLGGLSHYPGTFKYFEKLAQCMEARAKREKR